MARSPTREQDEGLIRAPESIHSEEQLNRWPAQQLHRLNSKTDMILSKDFRLKESLDNLNQISKKMGQVHNDILSQRERQKKLQVDQMLVEEPALEQQPPRQPNLPMPSNYRLTSAPYSSPSDFRYRAPEPLNAPYQRSVAAQQLTSNDFLFGGNLGPRPLEESVVINNTDRQEPPTRISYDEVPLDEYFSSRVGSHLMTNAQVYLRFKGFNKQAELEEEHRLKKEGLSLQQQIQDDNNKRNESFVRRLNDDFYLRDETN